jgi:hypothetical protein
MNYQKYEIGYAFKDSMKFIEVVAISSDSAIADCVEAGYEALTIKLS